MTSPLNGATDVSRSTAVAVVFNEAMSATTITTSSFSLTPSVAGSVSYNTNSRTAVFLPSAALAALTTYTATVSTACQDAAGNAMTAAHTWSFTTAAATAPGWTSLGNQVSPAGAESEDPTMLIVDDSPVVGYRHASYEVHLYQWSGSAWASAAADPSGGDANSSIYHAPAFCSDGSNAYLAYSHADDSGSGGAAFYDRVFVHQWTGSGSWSIMNGGAEVSVPWDAINGGADAGEPAIACLAGSDPWATWEELDVLGAGSDSGLWAAQVSSGSSARSTVLSRNDVVDLYDTSVRTVGVAVDSSGTVYAAQWESHQTDQDRTDLYVTTYNGTTFTPLGGVVTLDFDVNNLSKPSMAFLGSDVYIAYTFANNVDYTKDVYVRRYNSGGGTWDLVGVGPVSAFGGNHYDSANPDLIAAGGTLYLAWEESDLWDGPFIYVARWDSGGSQWVLDGDKLNVDTANQAMDPSLAFHDSTVDYLYVAFEENTDGWPHIFVKRKQL